MLRQTLNLQMYRNATVLIKRKISINPGGHGSRTASLLFPGNRRLHDMSPQMKTKQDSCRNVNVLNARDCSAQSTPPPPPPSDSGYLKWLIGLLAAGGIAGAAYYFTQGEDDSKTPAKVEPKLLRVPATSADIPKHVPYLLIGGGTTSFSAFRSIKAHDAKAKVLVISEEYYKPYMRPPLSKEIWYSIPDSGEMAKDLRFKQWTGSERSLFFEPDEFFEDPQKLMENEKGGIAICQGYTVKRVDPVAKKAILSDGTEISYNECLLATGGSPKNLNVFALAPKDVKDKVMTYRTPDDFEKLKKIVESKKSVTIIGSGFLGSELACSLSNYGRKSGLKITQMFYESGNMAKVLPEYLSQWTTNKLENYGVRVMPRTQIVNATSDHGDLKLDLSDGTTLLTDFVVVCVGCEANTDIASVSGLEVHKSLGGFVVNAELEARRNLFVAGDAACFYDPLLGRRRVEHHDHSVVSGRLAGENMVGLKKPYKHQSMFWSDLGPEIGYEGIGLVDSSLPTVGVFAKPSKVERADGNLDKKTDESKTDETKPSVEATGPVSEPKHQDATQQKPEDDFGKGVVFYLKDNKIVGIVLWNIFNRIGLARTILNQDKCYDDLNEVAKLFEIHS